MCELDESKKLHGQFFTITNPFINNAFYKWFESIPEEKRKVALEPFAGSNNIVQMINSLNLGIESWYCYDIEPPEYNAEQNIEVIKRDTIENFPTIENCYLTITNPPYLAKNSATRDNLTYLYPEYDDLYKKCLDIMLKNCEYVAAIIPESFITANMFHERLDKVISLNCKMFDDTDCPVCLALFSPETTIDKTNGFEIYCQNEYDKIGSYNELLSKRVLSDFNQKNWVFNDKNGEIGIICVDSSKTASIKFVQGSEISSENIKNSSRAKTRVSGLPNDVDLNVFIKKCNEILTKYREDTKDVFLTSFKGLRQDGVYRRRMDFETAKNIMGFALEELSYDK